MENIEKKEVIKDPKARSRSYPRYNLEEAIKFIEIVSKLGRKNISEKSVAAENGKSITNSGFIGRMSSAKQFGLISKDDGKLSLTQLGNEIMFPLDSITKMSAIKKAFTMPTLYRELLESFSGTKIPEYGSLGNRLLNDYGIEAGAKDLASKNFIKSAEYADVIQNGILVIDAEFVTSDSLEKDTKEDINIFNNNLNKDIKKTTTIPEMNMFSDSGTGWNLVIKSIEPLNSEIKKALIVISDSLKEINKDKE